MIASLRLTDSRNFADETLNLGPFTLIGGPQLHRPWLLAGTVEMR